MAAVQLTEAAKRIRKLSRLRSKLALVLGSGFNHVLSELDVIAQIPYAKLPGFPKPSVVATTASWSSVNSVGRRCWF